MPRSRLTVALSVGLALALVGCASPPADGGRYSSLVDLKAAFIKAGFSCHDWVHDNAVEAAKDSGTCGDDVVLSTYSGPDAVDEQVSMVRTLNETLGITKDKEGGWLIGRNWIVNAPHLKQLQEKLGGEIASTIRK